VQHLEEIHFNLQHRRIMACWLFIKCAKRPDCEKNLSVTHQHKLLTIPAADNSQYSKVRPQFENV
jgi:hypothetical protein